MRLGIAVFLVATLLSVGAQASVSSFFNQLLDSVQATLDGNSRDSDSGGDSASDPDSGAGGSGSVPTDPPESGYVACMGSVSASYDTRCMLTALVDEIVIPNYAKLMDTAQAFAAPSGPLGSYCSAISTAGESLAFADAETSWKSLVAEVQRTEVHAIGPASDNAFSLQYRLNSYMSGAVSTCGIDSIAASSNVDISARALNTRGIRALDYLLFNSDLDHTCAPQVTSTSGWNDLPEAERKSLRCDAAMLIASDMSDAAASIHRAWRAQGDNYRASFLQESNTFQSLQATTDSMFYLEKGTKDAKLGTPLGIITACPDLTCPEFVEAPYSGHSLQNVITNLEIWSEMFSSNAETGFDAHIESEGWPEVSQEFKLNLDKALQLANRIDDSIASQASAIESEADQTECTNAYSNPDTTSETFPMCTLYGLVKRIVDSFKIDFVTIVNVEIPGGSQSDND
jgi:uncharacterized protein